MSYKIILTSLLIHFFLLLFLNGPKTPATPIKIKITGQLNDLIIVPAASGAGNSKCKDRYSGIGITTDIKQVATVITGGPAYIAGVKSGDYILYPDVLAIRGKLGTIVSMTLVRNGQVLKFEIKRDWICQM